MRRRDFIRLIEENGWEFVREGGEHTIYQKAGRIFSVPRHREISPGVVRSWRRENERTEEA
ncbi:MAG: type II toxin-antitoxin system HicA family toxin [Armatimonadetes bacterium]|nr:type II toxin-antitoxin system HicA family toxin [Armatimonadota bacterium]